MQLDLNISIVPIGGGTTVKLGGQALTGIGERYVAMANLAGIVLRGAAGDTPIDAVKALLWEMTNASSSQTSKDAEVALGLAIDGRDLSDLMPNSPGVPVPAALANGDGDGTDNKPVA